MALGKKLYAKTAFRLGEFPPFPHQYDCLFGLGRETRERAGFKGCARTLQTWLCCVPALRVHRMNKRFKKIYRTFVKAFIEKASYHPNSLAIRSLADDYETAPCFTFEELNQRARIARLIFKLFVIREIGHSYYCERHRLCSSFFGCLYAGLIAVPAYLPKSRKRGHLERLIGILYDATPQVILTTSNASDSLGLLRAQLSEGQFPKLLFIDKLDPSASHAGRCLFRRRPTGGFPIHIGIDLNA